MNSGWLVRPIPEETKLRNAIKVCREQLSINPKNEYWLARLTQYKTRLIEIEKENLENKVA
jgi:hypothetical protein